MRSLTVCLVLLAATAALADPPDAAEMAKLQHDIDGATGAVDKKYAGKQLSPEETKQMMKERAAAENGVLDKAGVDRKDYARAQARMSKEDRATATNEREKLDKKDKAAAGAPRGGSTEVVVEKGGGKTDEEEAAEMDRAMGLGKSKGGGGKKRK